MSAPPSLGGGTGGVVNLIVKSGGSSGGGAVPVEPITSIQTVRATTTGGSGKLSIKRDVDYDVNFVTWDLTEIKTVLKTTVETGSMGGKIRIIDQLPEGFEGAEVVSSHGKLTVENNKVFVSLDEPVEEITLTYIVTEEKNRYEMQELIQEMDVPEIKIVEEEIPDDYSTEEKEEETASSPVQEELIQKEEKASLPMTGLVTGTQSIILAAVFLVLLVLGFAWKLGGRRNGKAKISGCLNKNATVI